MPQALRSQLNLLQNLRKVMAEPCAGQERLDKIVTLIARDMASDVCSVYFARSDKVLELSATQGLNASAVHTARLSFGEGLVGKVAEQACVINTQDAAQTKDYRYLPETGEEVFTSFAGVPIQRLGYVLGVLVVQDKRPRHYTVEEIDVLETVAMVLAEMSSTGRLARDEIIGENMQQQRLLRGIVAADGIAIGTIVLHEPKITVTNPIAEDIDQEKTRLRAALSTVRQNIDFLVRSAHGVNKSGEHTDVLEAFRMFAYDEGWAQRLENAITSGLSAEAAVERVQSYIRTRLGRIPDPYLRERLSDLDDLANRLLRELTGQNALPPPHAEKDIILVARNIGPAELLEYGRRGLKGVVLQEGALHAHAVIVARALNIPMLIQVGETEYDLDAQDSALLDAEQGQLIVRPEPEIRAVYDEKIALRAQKQASLRALQGLPCITRDGVHVTLNMNAGILADLPSIEESGAEGVGLYRTELLFMIRDYLPRREEQARLYRQVLEAGGGRPITFRTLDIGSDKILPYLKRHEEENPALGWRAIRVGLDRPLLMRMQFEALLKGAAGRTLRVMFPMVAEAHEFATARQALLQTHNKLQQKRIDCATALEVGAMLEMPSLAYAPDSFYQSVDFLSVGGNDLLQFFYAADRSNERVRQRYSIFNTAYLRFLQTILSRANTNKTPISFCGEAAGQPLQALLLVGLGFRALSMRPAAIASVKQTIRTINNQKLSRAINELIHSDRTNIEDDFTAWAKSEMI